MRPAGRQKLAQATYECSRCGDEYPFTSGDDEMLVKIHGLLHMAAEWRLLSAAGLMSRQEGWHAGAGTQ
jgi:hypothetical protein